MIERDPPDLLFTYGTLMRGFGLHRLLAGHAEFVGLGSVRARLLDLGAYPAAVPDPVGAVTGEVYRVTATGLWRVLDSAEGRQYDRGEVTVLIADGREVRASIYWYVGALDRGVPIPGGDYRAHPPARSIHHNPEL